MEHRVLGMLNRAFAADPDAIRRLLAVRIPCNEALADDPTIIVRDRAGDRSVGVLGLINGALNELGLPRVAAQVSTNVLEPRQLVGFCEYTEPKGE